MIIFDSLIFDSLIFYFQQFIFFLGNATSKRKRTELASIFDDNNRKTSILTSLKHAGIRCGPDDRPPTGSKRLVNVRRKSSESSTVTTCTKPLSPGVRCYAKLSASEVVSESVSQLEHGISDNTSYLESANTVDPLPSSKISNGRHEERYCRKNGKITTDIKQTNRSSKASSVDRNSEANNNTADTSNANTTKSSLVALVEGYSSSGSESDSDKRIDKGSFK